MTDLTKETGRHAAAEPILELDHVVMRFGGVVALRDANLTVNKGEIFALIGPNGAGKTTVFNVVTGVFRPSEGQIRFAGGRIDGMKRYRVTKSGIARTFQNIRLFHNMTAVENVMVGADAHHRTGAVGAALGLPWHGREEKAGREKAEELLDFVGIKLRAGESAKNLPYGDQRRLEIARALATDPQLLLLDEPAAGMNPAEKQSLQALIRKIRDSGRTVLLIEHDMGLVMGISDRVAVLDFGELIADGLPHEVQRNPKVIEAYLGAPSAFEVTDVAVHYGKIAALKDVTLEVEEGEIVALIGANGAGKTTTLKTISGLRPLSHGSVKFEGKDISRMPGHKRVTAGIGQAPEGRGVFPGMTVQENLLMGSYARKGNVTKELDEVYALFPRLAERKTQYGGTMSGGEQQMIAIGRALMAKPRVVLLDEPSMGLAPILVQQIFDIIKQINERGTTVLLVEQNAQQALQLAHWAYVLETGRVIKSAPAADLLDDPEVRAAYLGGDLDVSGSS